MGDVQEIALPETTSAPKPTLGSQVARVLRLHPSLPPPPNVSTLLRSAIDFEGLTDDRAKPEDLAGDGTGPARGIAVGLVLMLPFWGAVGFAIRAALR